MSNLSQSTKTFLAGVPALQVDHHDTHAARMRKITRSGLQFGHFEVYAVSIVKTTPGIEPGSLTICISADRLVGYTLWPSDALTI